MCNQLSYRKPRAKKAYRCVWCAGRIDVGEVHVCITGIYHDEFQVNRFHLECDDDCREAYSGEYCYEFGYGDGTRPAIGHYEI